MDVLIGVIAATLITALIINRPLQVKIIHKHEYPELKDTRPYEEPDQDTQKFYDDIGKITSNLTDVFGGGNETTR